MPFSVNLIVAMKEILNADEFLCKRSVVKTVGTAVALIGGGLIFHGNENSFGRIDFSEDHSKAAVTQRGSRRKERARAS